MDTLIFDWDGVLLDSFVFYYELNRAAMTAVGIALSADDYHGLFSDNVHAGFKRWLPDPDRYRIFLAHKAEHFAAGYRQCRLFPGVAELIPALAKKHTLAICSSTEKSFIAEHLTAAHLGDYFALVSGDQALNKAAALQAILAAAPTARPPTTMITDTSGDIATGKALGLRTMAVTWGFHTKTTLLAAAPDQLVNSPAQLAVLLSHGDHPTT